MKKLLFLYSLALVVLCFGMTAHAAPATKIDVLYMNHGPLMDTLNKMKGIFSSYGNRLTISWYDFDSEQGAQFMAKKGVKQHIPLVVWIDDSSVVTMGAKKVQFAGFPTGSGPPSFQGKWTLDDLKEALDQTLGKK